eukprot:1138521-Pyramimonas_sp.AAC.1
MGELRPEILVIHEAQQANLSMQLARRQRNQPRQARRMMNCAGTLAAPPAAGQPAMGPFQQCLLLYWINTCGATSSTCSSALPLRSTRKKHLSGKRAEGHQAISRSAPYASTSSHTTIRCGGSNVAICSMRSVGTVYHAHTWADSWKMPQARHHVPSAEVQTSSQLSCITPLQESMTQRIGMKKDSAGQMNSGIFVEN